jgi:hypothetical protein
MKVTIPKLLRCAIYTRKSTEQNLDLAFNSLDAQMLEVLCPGPSLAMLRKSRGGKPNSKVDERHRRSALAIARDAVSLYLNELHEKISMSPTITVMMLSEYW